jgi:hypothetical protein
LSAHVQGVHLQKEAMAFIVPLILVIPVSGLPIDMDKLKNKATPYIGPVATLESSFFLFL